MVPYLMKSGKAVLVDAAVTLHGKCLHRISSKDSLSRTNAPQLSRSLSASDLPKVPSKDNLRKVPSRDKMWHSNPSNSPDTNGGVSKLASSAGMKKVPSKSSLNGKPPRPI